MEFYRGVRHRKAIYRARFQFPTGWNSTFEREQIELQKAFQFPTGWNSTRMAQRGLGCKVGFNSQRDGILPCFYRLDQIYFLVSIPNGMEFYSIRPSLWLLLAEFQFPTGWNSTQKTQTTKAKPIVSIPNGMEFYNDKIAIINENIEFQFPTGWNSTFNLYHSGNDSKVFQFPTGWNSTF